MELESLSDGRGAESLAGADAMGASSEAIRTVVEGLRGDTDVGFADEEAGLLVSRAITRLQESLMRLPSVREVALVIGCIQDRFGDAAKQEIQRRGIENIVADILEQKQPQRPSFTPTPEAAIKPTTVTTSEIVTAAEVFLTAADRAKHILTPSFILCVSEADQVAGLIKRIKRMCIAAFGDVTLEDVLETTRLLGERTDVPAVILTAQRIKTEEFRLMIENILNGKPIKFRDRKNVKKKGTAKKGKNNSDDELGEFGLDAVTDDGEGDYEEVEFSDKFEEIDFEALGIDPSGPTTGKPGTEEKILMLAARYAAGVPLWHGSDCYDHSPSNSVSLFRSRDVTDDLPAEEVDTEEDKADDWADEIEEAEAEDKLDKESENKDDEDAQ